MKFLTLAIICIACQHTKPNPTPMLTAVIENKLFFSDGSTREIPHWGDSSYVTFFMVRHAERQDDGTKNPELTAEGQARAERLGRIMADSALDSVFATQYLRTQLTAEPVTRRSKSAPVATYLPEGQINLLDHLMSSSGGKRIFIVGHQNTVPLALNYLTGNFAYKNISDFDFGKFYVAVSKGIGKTEVLELEY